MKLRKDDDSCIECLMSLKLNIPSYNIKDFNIIQLEEMIKEFSIVEDCHIGLVHKTR